MIQLRQTLELSRDLLNNANIDFALIGGFGLGVHGNHRATKDIITLGGIDKLQVKAFADLFDAWFEIEVFFK